MRNQAITKIKELYEASQELSVVADDINFEFGDKIASVEENTGISATAVISKKIVKISNDIASYDYETIVVKKTK